MLHISKKEFDQLAAYVKSNYGINLTEKKRHWLWKASKYFAADEFHKFFGLL